MPAVATRIPFGRALTLHLSVSRGNLEAVIEKVFMNYYLFVVSNIVLTLSLSVSLSRRKRRTQ